MASGRFTKEYSLLAPLPLPMAVRVDFLFGGDIVGSQVRTVTTYGVNAFSFLTLREDLVVEGMTTKIYFQYGEQWSALSYNRIAPYAFNFPFCFSGIKFGWR